jgi:hypothetical protein
MAWHDFDWLVFETESYEDALHDRVWSIYRAADETLTRTAREQEQHIGEVLGEFGRDPDAERLNEMLGYEESRAGDQRCALASMVFAMTASLSESFLDEMKRYFNKTRPPKVGMYAGDGKMLRAVTEYRERFAIDLPNLPGFETLREVILARNSCLHNAGLPQDDYIKQTKCRFLDDTGRINVSPALLEVILGELKEFARCLSKSLSATRSDVRAVQT